MQPAVGAAGSSTGAAGAIAGSGTGTAGASGTGAAGATAGGAAGAAGASDSGMAGSGGGAPVAGSGGAAGGDGSTTAFKRPCVADGNEVVFIGDSYSDYAVAHGPMASFVADLAAQDGALMSGDSYRNLAVAGTTLATPPAAIQSQWTDAMSSPPIKAVVMTGGGNDVLIDNQQCRADGSEDSPDCQMVVANSLDAAKNLFASMKETGVSDVVYFWYPHIPGGLLTSYETGSTISDYTYPMLEALAESASTDTFHVHMVPTVQIFEGHPEYFYSDGLHANDDGTAKIAEAIWQAMKTNCIAQPASSGCCAP
jgi:lysophospholipase L1-like esterase